MSWDRVIQDSDEDEPLLEDEVSPPTNPVQGHEPPARQDQYQAVVQQAYSPIEPTTATEPQLSVNFDQFLQSQDGNQGVSTLSQQQREERWIPSTGGGGGGSIDPGAMISEIGAAQRRLFDDDASSADQRLPSTATPYPSEISQPGSFPTMESFQQYNQLGDAGQHFAYVGAQQDAPYEATQLIAPIQGQPYDYDTPATSNHVDSPLDGFSAQANAIPVPVHLEDGTGANPLQRVSQQSKFMQHVTDSPHDTEPMSSVASPGLNQSKNDDGNPGLMSPQHSQASANDELSMPAVSVDISLIKKKRGRPKKQPIPDDDEDDELSLPREDDSDLPKPAEKRRPGRPAKSAEVLETDENGEDSGTGDVQNADSLAATPTKDPELPQESTKPAPKEPKKKKAKGSKTDPEGPQISQKPAINDDVIWVDSRPLEIADNNTPTEPNTNITSTKPDTESKIPSESTPEARPSAPTTSTDEPSHPIQADEGAAPKKRGRKRKNATEEEAAQTAPATEQPNPELEPEAQFSHAIVESSSGINPISEAESSKENQPLPDQNTKQNEPLPETPQKQDTGIATPNKTTQRHSPISSTSKVPYRVGLSRRARIAPLLKVVRK